jgi:hypothetical protein
MDEREKIYKPLREYVAKHNGNAHWYVSFGNFDKNGNMVESISKAGGCINVVILELEALLKQFKKISKERGK